MVVEPNYLERLLRQALDDPSAVFKDDQREAIEAVLKPPSRALVVEATGWGKSMVYFLATRVLRDRGRGPTLVVSPLLSLMRNQVGAAARLGLVAEHYTSANPEQWGEIESRLSSDQIDLLLISPERLANDDFLRFVASSSLAKVGLLVIDEAHCISDWGHDFRPDYQRLGQLIRRLPPTTSVLATTATANDRVIRDVLEHIGREPTLIRGSLARQSLRLQVIRGLSSVERMAWLDSHLGELPGSGIIYTLTTRDADRLAAFLQQRGHSVEAYHAQLGNSTAERNQLRIERESLLVTNQVKALVATVALGMGFDKPDLGFVVHYQSPGNLVAYYQQIGRAGRAIAEAFAVLFLGEEDDEIHDFFIGSARPCGELVLEVLDAMDQSDDGLTTSQVMARLDRRRRDIDRTLRVLSALAPAPIVKDGGKWRRTSAPYRHDTEKDQLLDQRRRDERKRFLEFIHSDGCLMEQVRRELNDPSAEPCGRCANCLGKPLLPIDYRAESLQAALEHLNRSAFAIEPRKQWPSEAFTDYVFRGNISEGLRCSRGLCLTQYGDPGFASCVIQDKRNGHFRDELVSLAIEAIGRAFGNTTFDWVVAVPSLRTVRLVPDFARRLADRLGVQYIEAIEKVKDTLPQKAQQNGFHQARNLDGAFTVTQPMAGTVLLVDDLVDSRWTFTVVGALLRQAGAGEVIPLALSSSAPHDDDE